MVERCPDKTEVVGSIPTWRTKDMKEAMPAREGNEVMRMRGVCAIIQNSEGKILLQLRDDKPDIPFPNFWYLPGGALEEFDKSPEDGLMREMQEEMGITLDKLQLHKKYEWDDKDEYVYVVPLDLNVNEIQLTEGQKIQYFSREEIENMNLAFHDNEIARDFFKSQSS